MQNLWKKIGTGMAVLAALVLLVCAGKILETNSSSTYQIKQAAVSGKMSMRDTPGMYLQSFGSITTYRLSDDVHIEGTAVQFRDGSTGVISGTVKFRLPGTVEQRMKLHAETQTYSNVRDVLVENSVEGALRQTANLFGAEEVYSTRRSEFIQLFREQLENGIFKTKTGREVNEIVYNADGTPSVAKRSVLNTYGIEIVNIEIKAIDFDEKTDELIKSRKEAEQQETLARAEAERAKQDALTAEERGKASVATAKYAALVIKESEVIEAQKKTAIEEENTLQALEAAKQEKANGEAKAYSAKLAVQAGLSPKEQAEFDRDTAIGVAKAMSGLQFPSVMVLNQGSTANGSSPLNPFDAVGLKAFRDMAKENESRTPTAKTYTPVAQ